MSDTYSSSIKKETFERRQIDIKFRFLALGLIITLSSIFLIQFFLSMQNPPELRLPIEFQPKWTEDENLLITMNFIGNIGVVIGILFSIIGIFVTIYGFSIQIREQLPRKFERSFIPSLISSMQEDKNFFLMVIVAFIFGIVWFFNLLTYPPYGPFYFLREYYLIYYYPQVQLEDLPLYSTYGLFAVIQDTFILFIFFYIIYVRVRPGQQFGEEFVDFMIEKTLFLTVLMISSLFHAFGHLPFELYGRGQWGTGFSSIEAWISFDKIAHLLVSMAITMLIIAILSNQVQLRGQGSSVFTIIVGISFMISLGVFWEIYEWIMNALFDLGHFVDEILDAPKDLLWDVIGAILGAILAHYDIKRNKIIKISENRDI